MSTEPDNELFGIIYAVTDKPDWAVSEVHDAILAAGYRKPRTVTTAEELDAAVERAARVLVEVGRWGVPWEDATDKDRKEMLELARTVLTAAITEDWSHG